MKPRGEDQARVRRYQTQLQCRGSLTLGVGRGTPLASKQLLREREREGQGWAKTSFVCNGSYQCPSRP